MARTYHTSDSTANDSDKTLTPPSENVWLTSLRIEYTCTADAGTRTLEVRFRDADDDVIWATEIETGFILSDIMVVNLSPGAAKVIPVDNSTEGAQHLAPVCFREGWDVQVIDTAAIQAAADDMVLHAVWVDD